MYRILEDREKRYYKTLELLEEYKVPVVCGKLNYPGENKNTEYAIKGFGILRRNIVNAFGEYTVEFLELEGFDGSAVLAVVELNASVAKEIAVKLEESGEIGRIFDIDVYIEGGNSISRTELGMIERKCIVCGDNARVCMKSAKHSLQETVDAVNNLIGKCE